MLDLGTIGLIGGGNMGSSLIGGLVRTGYDPSKIWVADPNEQNRTPIHSAWGVYVTADNKKVAELADIVILAIKPHLVQAIIQEISLFLRPKMLLMSIAAGITTTQIQHWLNEERPIVRAMPNTPALLGHGIAGLFATDSVSPVQRKIAEQLLQAVGQTVWIEQEHLMDVVTALSGSGPAYFFYIMQGLVEGATALGLSNDSAVKLTLYTALGSAMMALHATEDLQRLREKVTSPQGTTEQGIQILNDGKLFELLFKTLTAATHRGKELSQQFN